MPMFGSSVEAFLNTVIDRWDDLYVIPDFDKLCKALYTLYHRETEAVQPSKSQSEFAHCMEGLVQLHKEAGGTVKLKKTGYTEFHTNSSLHDKLDTSKEPYRVYVNASTKNVIVLGRILVNLVCLSGRALYFKIADDAAAVDKRKDAIVIYTFGKDQSESIAKELGTITDQNLTPSSPGLTKEIAPGISVAADPRWNYSDQVSFGQHRVRPFATALLCYRDEFALGGQLNDVDQAAHTEVFRILLMGAFRAHNINALDPSTNAPAITPTISKAQEVEASKVQVPKMDKMAARRFLSLAQRGAVEVH
jgi:hypothetical protein